MIGSIIKVEMISMRPTRRRSSIAKCACAESAPVSPGSLGLFCLFDCSADLIGLVMTLFLVKWCVWCRLAGELSGQPRSKFGTACFSWRRTG